MVKDKNNAKKNRRVKKKSPNSTHQIISKILRPICYTENKNLVVSQAFNDFVIYYNGDDFEKIFKILIKKDVIKAELNQYADFKNCFEKEIFIHDISISKVLSMYKVILLDQKELLIRFDLLRAEVDKLIVQGHTNLAIEKIRKSIHEDGNSFWAINTLFYLFSLNNDYDELNNFHKECKEENKSLLYEMIIDVAYRRVRGADAKSVVEETTIKMNEELVAGGATFFAALTSLLFLPYPLYDDVLTFEGLFVLQSFPLVDVYFLLTELLLQTTTEVSFDKSQFDLKSVNTLTNIFIDLKNLVNSPQLSAVSAKAVENLSPLPKKNVKFLIDFDTDNYDKGNYLLLVNSLENEKEYSLSHISKANYYAKSYLYSKKSPSSNLPEILYFTIRNLMNIYSLNKSEQSISEMLSMIIKLGNTEISKHLMISLRNAIPKVINSCKYEKLKLMLLTPTTQMAISDVEPVLFFSPVYLEHTPDSRGNIKSKLANLIIEDIGHPSIPNLLESFKASTVIKKEYIELKHSYLFRADKKDELISFAASELISNSEAIITFDIEPIATYINECQIGSIEAVIFSYFYNLEYEKQIDALLNEAFEEYTINEGGGRPSQIIERKEKLTPEEVFIFTTVSSVNVMDYLGCFNSTIDLKMERLKIISLLRVKGVIQRLDYDTEYKQIIDDIVVESGVAQFSQSKIDIDIISIIDSNKQAITNTILSFREPNETGSTEDKYFANDDLSENDNGFVKGTKNELAVKLYEVLYRDFLKNEGYGLDSKLSAEIRHSFFSNQICNNLQVQNILYDLETKSGGDSKEYWQKKYSYMRNEIVDEIHIELFQFSEDVIGLIEKAEGWMKASITPINDIVFCFPELTIDNFENIKRTISNAKTPEEVGEYIVNLLMESLDECLKKMRHKLNEDFLIEADEIFSSLISNITNIKGTTALSELFISINTAKENMKEDVKTVCEWFSLNTGTFVDFYPLESVLKIAKTCLYQSFSNDTSVKLPTQTSVKVNGKHVAAIVLSLINCFHNAMKYGARKTNIDVLLNTQNVNNYSIHIVNSVSKTEMAKLMSGRFDKISTKLTNMDSTKLLVEEGDSGLYKAKHQLISANAGFDLIPKIIDDKFIVEIIYDEKSINC